MPWIVQLSLHNHFLHLWFSCQVMCSLYIQVYPFFTRHFFYTQILLPGPLRWVSRTRVGSVCSGLWAPAHDSARECSGWAPETPSPVSSLKDLTASVLLPPFPTGKKTLMLKWRSAVWNILYQVWYKHYSILSSNGYFCILHIFLKGLSLLCL